VFIFDILRWNDWNIRRFFIFIWSLLVAYDFSFVSYMPFNSTKILSQILGFSILTFVPGYIILRILKIHNLDRVASFLLAIGLSLSFIMVFGFSVNIFLPYIGISRPISTFPLFYSLNIAILILLIISYFRDRKFSSSEDQLCITFSPNMFFLFLPPILSIYGTYFMNLYNFNMLLMILLFIISFFPVLVALNRIPQNLYSFMILSMSISILFGLNLISTHLWSYDIFLEAYSSNYILQNGIWDPTIGSIIPLLLFTILGPTYSLLCDLSIVWVFKIVFPLLFSFTPLVLYHVYLKLDFGDYKLDHESATLSVFVFVFFYGFFKSMPDKQHLAELFLMLILMLSVIKINVNIRIILFIFSFSLVACHYGISYLFMISLFFISAINKFKTNTYTSLLTPVYTVLFSILAISWFIYVSDGYKFEQLVRIGDHFLSSILELSGAGHRSGISYVNYSSKTSILWVIYKLVHIVLQFFIFIGVLNLLRAIFNKKTRSFEISLISIFLYMFLFVQIFKSYGMGFDRVLQISLILLSPLSLWGFTSILTFLNQIYTYIYSQTSTLNKINGKFSFTSETSTTKKTDKKNLSQKAQLPFAIFLLIFFLFNSGFVFEIADDPLPSYCINLNKSAGWPVYSEGEVCGVNWLKSNEAGHRIAVYNQWSSIKSRDGLLVREKFHPITVIPIQMYTQKLYLTYIFLGKDSMDKVQEGEEYVELEDTRFYEYTLNNSNKIYNSGKSNLYLSKGFEDSQSIFSAGLYYDLNSDSKSLAAKN
jgi:uncharacterized membrane protein